MLHHQDLNIDLETLERSSRDELRALWTQELGDKPPQSLGRDVLALGIAYARQERLYGGLTRPVTKELDRLLAHALADGAIEGREPAATPLPRTGTILVREWHSLAMRTWPNAGCSMASATRRGASPPRPLRAPPRLAIRRGTRTPLSD
jgi:hypothetical protein